MSEISRFYGIIIAMFWDDHNPPHFHAWYGGNNAAIEIGSLRISDGALPPRAFRLVVEWASQHYDELIKTGRRHVITGLFRRLNHYL